MHADIEYMDEFENFTIGDDYAGLPEYVTTLKESNIHFVPIIDAGIKASGDTFSRGNSVDAYILSAANDEPLIGSVWPGDSVFVDFTIDEGKKFWQDEFTQFKQLIDFDGIWLDMNEAANFADGTSNDAQRIGLDDEKSI